MNFTKWEILNDDLKNIYFLGLCDTLIKDIEHYDCLTFVEKSLNSCWEWVRKKDIHPDDFVNYLADDETRDSMVILVQYKKYDKIRPHLTCIICALIFTLYRAYRMIKQTTTEIINEMTYDGIYDDFFRNFYNTSSQKTQLRKTEDILFEYLNNSNERFIEREVIINFLKNNIKV